MAAVVLEDFWKPFFKELSHTQTQILIRLVVLVFGLVCVGKSRVYTQKQIKRWIACNNQLSNLISHSFLLFRKILRNARFNLILKDNTQKRALNIFNKRAVMCKTSKNESRRCEIVMTLCRAQICWNYWRALRVRYRAPIILFLNFFLSCLFLMDPKLNFSKRIRLFTWPFLY